MKKFGGIFSCSNFNTRAYDAEIKMELIILNMQSTDYFKNLIFDCMMRTHCSACPCCSTQIDT